MVSIMILFSVLLVHSTAGYLAINRWEYQAPRLTGLKTSIWYYLSSIYSRFNQHPNKQSLWSSIQKWEVTYFINFLEIDTIRLSGLLYEGDREDTHLFLFFYLLEFLQNISRFVLEVKETGMLIKDTELIVILDRLEYFGNWAILRVSDFDLIRFLVDAYLNFFKGIYWIRLVW